MPTATKRSSAASAAAGPRKTAVEAAKPSLRFHHSRELRAKTLTVLDLVESAEVPNDHAERLIGVVLELTQAGLDQYFLQTLKTAKANFVVQQSAALGVSGVQKLMGTVIRNILGRMDNQQLVSVCRSIRGFMA